MMAHCRRTVTLRNAVTRSRRLQDGEACEKRCHSIVIVCQHQVKRVLAQFALADAWAMHLATGGALPGAGRISLSAAEHNQ